MTISSTTRTAGPFTGTGVATLFPFAFKVFVTTDVYVETIVIATGVETILALNADYTVVLNSNQDSAPGGTVLLAVALAAGSRLVITSDMENLQNTEYLNQGGFYPEVLTASLDLATILIQQLQDALNLSLQYPTTDPATNNVMPSAEVRAGQVLGFDAFGAPTILPAPSVAIGTTTMLPAGSAATVTNVGTATSLILNFGIPIAPTQPAASFTFIDTITGLPVPISIQDGALVY